MVLADHFLICRMAALWVLARTKHQVQKAAQAHYKHTALARTRRSVLKRLAPLQQKHLGRKPRVSHPEVTTLCLPSCTQPFNDGGATADILPFMHSTGAVPISKSVGVAVI